MAKFYVLVRCLRIPCLLLLLLSAPKLLAQSDHSVAILDLEGRNISQAEASTLTDRMRTAIVRSQILTVVERGQMEAVLAEQNFQISGCTSNECAVEVGQLLGVTNMVAGSIGKVGSTFSVDIRIIDIETGTITSSIWRDHHGAIDGLLAIMPDIADELIDIIMPTSLLITSEPVGARVVIEGSEAGSTPHTEDKIEYNKQIPISISKDNYITLDTLVYAQRGKPTQLNLQLVPAPSRLVLSSRPSSASVHLNNVYRGLTPYANLVVESGREHLVSFRLDGYKSVDSLLYCLPGSTHELSVMLEALPVSVSILSYPSSAEVFINNQLIGETPLIAEDLSPFQRYRLSIKSDGYITFDSTITLQPDPNNQLSIQLQGFVERTALSKDKISPDEEDENYIRAREIPLAAGNTVEGDLEILSVRNEKKSNKVGHVKTLFGKGSLVSQYCVQIDLWKPAPNKSGPQVSIMLGTSEFNYHGDHWPSKYTGLNRIFKDDVLEEGTILDTDNYSYRVYMSGVDVNARGSVLSGMLLASIPLSWYEGTFGFRPYLGVGISNNPKIYIDVDCVSSADLYDFYIDQWLFYGIVDEYSADYSHRIKSKLVFIGGLQSRIGSPRFSFLFDANAFKDPIMGLMPVLSIGILWPI